MTQRDVFKQTTVVNSKHELFDLILSPTVEVHDMYFINENIVWVNWSYREEAKKHDVVMEARNLSLITGAYTTAQARLLLYEELSKIGERMLYCDTDSIIYVETINNPHEYKPKIGTNVGDLTDEINSNAMITEFCSVGPKSYSLRLDVTEDNVIEKKEISKLKGFICTTASKENLSFENYKKMIFGCCNDDGAIDKHTIISKTNNINRRKYFNVVTVEQQKRFGFTYDKRIVTNNFGTIPYGYNEN